MQLIHRWWDVDSPTPPDSLWDDDRIIDWSLDITRDPAYHPNIVLPAQELRHRANIARLRLLYDHGGWWVDHDARIDVPLDTLPFPMTAAHHDRSGRARCNCIMGFPAGHPDLARVLDHVAASTAPRGRSTEASGEVLLTIMLPSTIARVESGWTHRGDFSVDLSKSSN